MELEIYCVPEDRPRTRLLITYFEHADMRVRLYDRPAARVKTMGAALQRMLILSHDAMDTPWMQALMQDDTPHVAVLIDEVTPPPGARYHVDLHTWPGRSADRNMGDLMAWLRRTGGADTRPRRTFRSVPQSRGHSGSGQRDQDNHRGQWIGLAMFVVFAAGFIALLDATEVGTDTRANAEPVTEQDNYSLRVERSPGVEQPDASQRAADSVTPATSAASATSAEQITGTAPEEMNVYRAPWYPASSTVARLCAAQTFAAAWAWAGTLTPRHAHSIKTAACVSTLLQRFPQGALSARIDQYTQAGITRQE